MLLLFLIITAIKVLSLGSLGRRSQGTERGRREGTRRHLLHRDDLLCVRG